MIILKLAIFSLKGTYRPNERKYHRKDAPSPTTPLRIENAHDNVAFVMKGWKKFKSKPKFYWIHIRCKQASDFTKSISKKHNKKFFLFKYILCSDYSLLSPPFFL
jgi:hypothetical protein